MKSFLTGSRVYGTPHENSDLDMVVLCNPIEFTLLTSLPDSQCGSGSLVDSVRRSVRYGSVNLICLTREDEFEAWRKGTEYCKLHAPVSRETAVATIGNYLHEIDIHYSELTSGPEFLLVDDDMELCNE